MQWTQQRACICELTEARAACMNSGKAQARQNSSLEGEGEHEVPTLTEGLLAMDACWEKESFFFFLKCGPCGRRHIQEHMGNTNLI